MLFKDVSKTTSLWSLFFVVSALTLNFIPESRQHAIFYSGDEEWSKGGPVVREISPLVSSGLPIRPISASEAQNSSIDEENGAAIGVSNPLTNLFPARDGLKRYKVRQGDTIANIAVQFGITQDTIKWANQAVRSPLRLNQELIILPISGILYTVRSGDTLESIADRYQITTEGIKKSNMEYQKIVAAGKGTIILPLAKPLSKNTYTQPIEKLPDLKNYFVLPVAGYNWAELHAENAVDIANKCGTPIYAAADGLMVADSEYGDGSGEWNGGYGQFILLEHTNGTKTRYTHLSKTLISVGDQVTRGSEIGLMGNTGNTDGPTGCHLHFEVYGAKNPFATR
ncbi:MAG: peptidoglycan DD-metalloendopeptidase family protein [Candidatus Paceibacterota bacterium]